MGMSIVEQLRKTARDKGLTPYRIAKDSGAHVATIQKWWAGGGLRCDTADAIAAALGCRITLEPIQRKRA